MVDWLLIIGASVVVSAIFIYLILRLRGQDTELSTFINETIEEMQQLNLNDPDTLKAYMTQKMNEIDGDFKDQFSDVIDESGLEFGEYKDDETRR